MHPSISFSFDTYNHDSINPGSSPELLQAPADSGKKTDSKFDTMEFMPSSLVDGQSILLRPLGTFGTGHTALYYRWPVEQQVNGELKFAGYDFAEAWPGDPAPNAARAVDWSNPARPKIEGEFVRPKRALMWTVFNQDTKRVEVAVLEQRSLKDGIIEIIGESDDYTFSDDGIANFCLKITRKGLVWTPATACCPSCSSPPRLRLLRSPKFLRLRP